MKPLKFIFFSILLLVSGFILTGLLFKAIRYNNEIEINAPVDKVFSIFTDTVKWKEYVPDLKSVSTISGKPYSPGWKVQIIIKDETEEYKLEETLKSFKTNSYYSSSTETEILNSFSESRFMEKNGKTIIKTSSEVRAKNIFWRSVFIYSSELFKDGQQEQLENIKKIAEKK